MAYRTIGDAMERVVAAYRRMGEAARDEVFITILPEHEARAAVERAFEEHPDGALTGMILAVKDNIDVQGFRTTAACPSFGGVADEDAAVIAELKAEGAVVIGKTNLDQFATGLVGTRSPYGAVRDARRPDRISGGSSSGSAVAVALGFVDAALGTDTAGSGRVPAGLQGIVGIKPTLGTVSTDGVIPACASYDCVTIFAGEQPTAELVMSVMVRSGRRAHPSDERMCAPSTPVVGVPRELPELSEAWVGAFRSAVETLAAAGAEIRDVDLAPSLAAAKMLYESPIVAERYEAVGDFVDEAPAESLDPTVARIIRDAGGHTGHGVLAARRELERRKDAAMVEWDDADIILVPTAPFHPTIADLRNDPVGVNARMGTYTNFCNLFDLCAVAVPAGTAQDDGGTANFGVTVLARAFDDAVAADVAEMLSGSVKGCRDAPDGTPASPSRMREGSLPIAVFGAHLSGQPLNRELVDHGGVLEGTVRTAAGYRLFALDTVPPKPGLVPAADGCGAAIEGEVWLLSPAALGRFLATLPAPMTLGAVDLDDGRSLTGFSCLPSALEGARDITEFGGWRAYLASTGGDEKPPG